MKVVVKKMKKQEILTTNSVSNLLKKVVIVSIAIIVLFIISTCVFFVTSLTPVDSKTDETTEFILEKGWGVNKIADELEASHLIKNAFILKIYIKMNDYPAFQAGTYRLSKSMSAEEIITSLTTGTNIVENTVKVTFVEGKRFPYYVKKISENFNYKEEDIMSLVTSEEFLNKLIKNYWFIDESILNKDLYYPLEGYLFPDTYEFKKDATIEDIVLKMIDALGTKLNNYKDEITLTNKNVSSLLTLASMVELEAVTPEDRAMVAGIFNNRLKSGMTLGSDVTTYYAVRKEMTQSLTKVDLNSCNAYNTRGECVSGLPVGPICSPSLSSIVASITPNENDYYYFVADKNNKVYPSKTGSEQDKVINNLKSQGLWPE